MSLFQIHTVVSGALDRLHYEKDPCVKYDVNRKLWIYLHRHRTEEEFGNFSVLSCLVGPGFPICQHLIKKLLSKNLHLA